MIARELVKSEIDKIQFSKNKDGKKEWLSFIEGTYGCLSDDPIEKRPEREI